MTTLTITLPDNLAKIAHEKGVLSPDAIESYVRKQILEISGNEAFPPGFDHQLIGVASPELMGTVKYHGDIVAPLDIKWGT
jgi:hypothetical protein